ncbi:MAG: UDP-N-acetylmuramoyl-L-alanyl-D-glutamate--2,6-diaminopimelate ligase [Gammaproteobacteria bacterium]|nr:UDP-N-acetylmuramoyl-L-alanyl-D-glutamate--2,6-diaminopimelate ligase [Gammaproteobacteria bacterium]MYH47437.1 UDP-N-acetylmuramoyl-L-alanyl-D-glutamate--2,6-diaminopimelate ligase [Gammaproteobacteria bacterium]MYL12379.1 UDP-N-acetylmuramoyl-L-alanyl-D-glutamate--2,6-diaminopimelate ligase [Gammaproteobacteria bacterium]
MNSAEPLPVNASLPELIHGLVDLGQEADELDIEVSGVQLDSRKVRPGELFMATFGRTHDAREFIGAAISRGAAAVLAESGRDWRGVRRLGNIPVIAVDHLMAKTSEIAGRFYREPSGRLSVIGVTGTNGKTTCSQYIARLLERTGCPAGVIGTLGYGVPGELAESPLTTPDAVFAQMALAEMAHAGLRTVAMEVSSVGLHQRRVNGVHFDTAVFTNLTRDHLDYHDSMEAYGASKRRLFSGPGLRHAVINLDDPYGIRVVNDLNSSVDVTTFGIGNRQATIRAEDVTITKQGFRAEIHTPAGSGLIDCKLLGRFNVSNILAAIGVLLAGHDRRDVPGIERICELASDLRSVDGRMEVQQGDDDVAAVVDYAHTPDGLEGALRAVREHFTGRLWCVFGCGGNRDRGKRPIMGALAEKLADRVVITDDNPRLEDGDAIVSEIRSGMAAPAAAHVERDRERAIRHAIAGAEPGDVMLIAGKGHEDYQEIGAKRSRFSDAGVVRKALLERASASREAQPETQE